MAKFIKPNLTGGHNATLSHEFFDITIDERKTKVQPDAMTDDFRWEAIAFVER
ncbi:hypothetical protein KSC_044720 [Ktedonobacter sp. SOSP1-52]|nr:hypothetical protein KSC_044720 [Ktedonobacter sp. SOSP1-52]